jgi:hypothetical protein
LALKVLEVHPDPEGLGDQEVTQVLAAPQDNSDLKVCVDQRVRVVNEAQVDQKDHLAGLDLLAYKGQEASKDWVENKELLGDLVLEVNITLILLNYIYIILIYFI